MSSKTKSKPAPQPPASKGLPVFPLVLVAVVVIGIIAVLAVALGGSDETSSTKVDEVTGETVTINEFQDVAVAGAPLPKYVSGTEGGVGDMAPDVTGLSFDGSPVSIKNDGQPKLVVFLAHWCPHCQSEIGPLSEAITGGTLPVGVDIYGVATATEPNADNFPPSEWIEREGFTPPVLVDDRDSTAASAFGLSGFPFFVLIDANGVVVQRVSGELGSEAIASLMKLALEEEA